MIFPLDPDDVPSLLALGACTASFVAFHYGFHAYALTRRHGVSQRTAVHLQRLAGAALLGILPLATLALTVRPSREALGLGAPDLRGTAAFVFAVALLVLPVVWRAQSRPESWALTPQIRDAEWSPRDLWMNALTWAIYLFGYELMFRGVLLFTLSARVGPWMAVAITTCAYVFAHLPKPAAETTGTLPMGVFFALASLATGSIAAPLLAHLAIALVSDYSAIRANPRFTIKSG